MNDQSAQNSYVNSYQPPVDDVTLTPLAPTTPVAPVAPTAPTETSAFPAMSAADPFQPQSSVPPIMPARDPSQFTTMPTYEPPMTAVPTPRFDDAPVMSAPVMPAPTLNDAPAADTMRSVSQTLEDQNIFFLLGVTDGTDDEREAFLDELQQVIWEDFVENDVELLITSDEMIEFKKIMEKGDTPEVQEEMIVYLEKLIPDLEEIMLEKALELKEDMVRERIAGMKTYFQDKPESLQKVEQAEQLINQDQWRAAAEQLNGLVS